MEYHMLYMVLLMDIHHLLGYPLFSSRHVVNNNVRGGEQVVVVNIHAYAAMYDIM